MLYGIYQGVQDALAPFRGVTAGALSARDHLGGMAEWGVSRSLFAAIDVAAGARVTHRRPPFGIDSVLVGNAEIAIREEVTFSLPFGDLLHFAKDHVATPQPKMLVVAPLSGHFATLLRDTVATLLQDHDVYITDWVNARDVPLSAGPFGFDDYVDYLIRFLTELGPGANILAVCQPCVQALAAVAVMAEDGHPAQPRTMTLMGGPVDTRLNPTVVNELATSKPLSWFEQKLISTVPNRYPGAGRRVYPGFLQLSAFMQMNMGRHCDQHRALYQFLADGDLVEADKIRTFYDEYFAVIDLAAEFYLETIDLVFQRQLLAKGELEFRGALVRPDKIRKTALLTVEGERDDICAVGQTSAAHDLCTGLRPHLKRHHLQPGVGHYGIFAGRKWETQVYPQVKSLVLAMN
jgi:poly(3-hydroxybutyrate) depolymerase